MHAWCLRAIGTDEVMFDKGIVKKKRKATKKATFLFNVEFEVKSVSSKGLIINSLRALSANK